MSLDQNNLSPLNYRFLLKEIPNTEFRVQSVSIPGMQLGLADIPNSFIRLQDTGTLEYGPLSISFLVGENMSDFLEIYNWLLEVGMPDGFGQYNRRFSDGSVMILNSAYRPIIRVDFTNLFPIALSGLEFNSTDQDLQYIRATASFNFDRFYFTKLQQ